MKNNRKIIITLCIAVVLLTVPCCSVHAQELTAMDTDTLVEEYLFTFTEIAFINGFAIATFMQFLIYGIFKALSLVGIYNKR